jgi:hypothetical protein
MDATTPRDLDQLDSEALKALVLALHEQVFSHQKQLTTHVHQTSGVRFATHAAGRCWNR